MKKWLKDYWQMILVIALFVGFAGICVIGLLNDTAGYRAERKLWDTHTQEYCVKCKRSYWILLPPKCVEHNEARKDGNHEEI